MPKPNDNSDDLSPEEAAFLELLAADTDAGAAKPMDPKLAALVAELTAGVDVDLDAPVDVDVDI